MQLESTLMKIKDTVGKYANVLSEILKVDVEIVDSNLVRVAGTGRFNKQLDADMSSEGHVYKMVIDRGEKMVIENPGQHEACMRCAKLGHCDETFDMSAPIKVFDRVVGVIGFVCFTVEQKANFISNYSVFMNFLDQISDLIASKAIEEIEREKTLLMMRILGNVVEKVEQGVMIVNDNRLINLNEAGYRILDLPSGLLPLSVEISRMEMYQEDYYHYKLVIQGKERVVRGREFQLYPDYQDFYRVILFNEDTRTARYLASGTWTELRGLNRLIGVSPQIAEVKEKARRIAQSSSMVLITGESGTGKELLARAIHEESPRSKGPLVVLNCAGIPENLLESELFGYVKGAFTGADPRGKAGKFEMAQGGTLLLDEIGDLSLFLQAKILRAVERKEVGRLGSNRSFKFDVRIISATNKNLESMIAQKTYREDLYYRLNVVPLHIPPLRERKSDIECLTQFFIDQFSQIFGRKVILVEEDVRDIFQNYSWPGNVRELENTLEYLFNLLGDENVIVKKLLPAKLVSEKAGLPDNVFDLHKNEKESIRDALNTYGLTINGKREAAVKLGISVSTLYRKMKAYGLF
jgi:sigma-54 dependent transcriptional regulator, acetoin dehydrogenase operon transcriptional activator AcoR